MKIKIIKDNENYWNIQFEDKYATKLTYDEMLGLFVSLTLSEPRPFQHWLKTKAEQAEIDKTSF